MPEQTTDKELQSVIASMIKEGKSEEEITTYVQQVDDLQHPYKARLGGVLEGAVPGILNGITALPMAAKDAVVDAYDMLHGKDPENAKAFVNSLATFLPRLKEAGPREQARMITELATTLGTGAGEAGALITKGKSGIRLLGKGMEYAGEHPMATRMAGGAGIMGGLYRGNPEMVAAGLATQAIPPILSKYGKQMIKFGGGETSEMIKAGKMPSSARDINVRGPIRTIPAEQAPVLPNTDRVPNVGMPATANSRVQRVQMDEAKAESAAARGQAASAGIADEDPMVMGRRLSTYPPEIQAKFRAGDPGDPRLGASIKAGDPARPAIRVGTSPNTVPASPLPGEQVRAIGSQAVNMGDAAVQDMRKAGMTVPATGIRSSQDIDALRNGPQPTGVRMGRPAPRILPSTDLDKLMRETHVPEDLEIEGVEGINPPPPSAGSVLGKESSTPLSQTKGFKDLQAAVKSGPTNLTSETPSNLLMGSELSPTEMMSDIRARSQGGGIRIGGRNPIQLKTGTAPLSAEAKATLDQYMKENPEADMAVVEQALRKLSGQ